MKIGDLVRIKRGYEWRFRDTRDWARNSSPLLVLRAGDDTIKICNVEKLWVPKSYFEVISEARCSSGTAPKEK